MLGGKTNNKITLFCSLVQRSQLSRIQTSQGQKTQKGLPKVLHLQTTVREYRQTRKESRPKGKEGERKGRIFKKPKIQLTGFQRRQVLI